MDILLDMDEYILKAEEYFGEGELVKAKRVLGDLLLAEPDCAQGHFLMGLVLRCQVNDFKRSEYHFRLAVKLYPEHPEANFHYVSLLNYLGKYEKAIEAADKALTNCGGIKGDLYSEKAKALEMLGKHTKAAQAYKMAIRSTTNEGCISNYKSYLQRAKKKIKKKKPKKVKENKLKVSTFFSKPQIV